MTFTGAVDAGTLPITYTWNFGDGSAIAAEQVVTHTFPVESIALPYTVVMTATNTCSSAHVQQVLTVSLYRAYLPVVIRE